METSDKDFVSTVDWEDASADCVAITCSDHRFRRHTEEFLDHLGYKLPHIISFPAGPALLNPMVASLGVFTKTVEHLLEKAISVARGHGLDDNIDLILVGHEMCAAYKAGGVKLLDFGVRQLTGKSVAELQAEHLKKTARRIAGTFRKVEVKVFFAEMVAGEKKVIFRNIEF